MGREAKCSVEWQGRAATGTLLLETTELLFRGALRLEIPRANITGVTAEGGALRVTFGGHTATFALGAQAEAWARAVATVKSRLDKLGVAPGLVVSVIGVDDPSFHGELRERLFDGFADGTPQAGGDIVFFGAHVARDLERFGPLSRTLKPNGALWVIRAKGHPDVTEGRVRAAGLGAGLVDVKVASFSPTHTAEKFVIPLAARGAAAKGGAKARAKPKRG